LFILIIKGLYRISKNGSDKFHIKKINSIFYKIKNDNEWVQNCLRDETSVIEALSDICCLSFCNIDNDEYHSYPVSTFLEIARVINGWDNKD
jgi:hypothetical protein